MWLFTSFGFFSAVKKPGDSDLTIRSRVADDLDQLRDRYLPDLSPTQSGGGTDYPYRATVTKTAYALALSNIARDLDYANFKDTVAANQGMDRAKAYSKVWGYLLSLDKSNLPPNASSGRKRHSYGGIVINGGGDVLMIEPKNHFDGYMWTFPKGRAKEGETPVQAAIREVIEETGQITCKAIPVPGAFEGGTTLNQYFLMEPTPLSKVQENREVSSTKWASYSEARALILRTTNTVGRNRDLAVLDAGFMAWHQENINRHHEFSRRDPAKRNKASFVPMKTPVQVLQITRLFSEGEMDQIRRGYLAESMDEKWNLYFEEDRLFGCRSWTGFCLYEAKFSRVSEKLWQIDELKTPIGLIEDEGEEFVRNVFLFLIDHMLLGNPVSFPRTSTGKEADLLNALAIAGQPVLNGCTVIC